MNFKRCLLIMIILFMTVILVGCKPVYTVIFYDHDGNIISEQMVKEGDSAIAPMMPYKEDFEFISWDKDFNNVCEDLLINPIFKKVILTITFIDGEEQIIKKIRTNEQVIPPNDSKYTDPSFIGWTYEGEIFDFNLYITSDMQFKALWDIEYIVRIGFCGSLSGVTSYYGLASKKGVELAIEEINAAGGIKINGIDYTIEVVEYIDDQNPSYSAQHAVNKFVLSEVDIIVGATTSSCTEELVRESLKYGIPVVIPTASADVITKNTSEVDRTNVFRACFYESYQAKYMADWAHQNNINDVFIVYNSKYEYSISLKDSFYLRAQEYGMNISERGYTEDSRNYYQDIVTNIINSKSECVYIADYSDKAALFISELYKNGYDGFIYGWYGWDGLLYESKIGSIDKKYLEKCYYTNEFHINSERENVKKFIEEYNKKYNTNPQVFSALGYDTIYMIKQALINCKTLGYEDIIKSLNNTIYKNLITSYSDFQFDEQGDPLKACIIISYKNGEEVEVNKKHNN